MVMRAERVHDRPIVDKPAAVAKAPLSRQQQFQHAGIQIITERNLLTLAKDSIAGIISGIIVLGGGVSSRGLHDGGRCGRRELSHHANILDLSTLLHHPLRTFSTAMSQDPYHAVQREIQTSLQTASTLRASYLRIRSTARDESEELVWARNEVRIYNQRFWS